MKKGERKQSKKSRAANKLPGKDHKPAPEEENDKSFDFGGLPDRDLKKNLGCG